MTVYEDRIKKIETLKETPKVKAMATRVKNPQPFVTSYGPKCRGLESASWNYVRRPGSALTR